MNVSFSRWVVRERGNTVPLDMYAERIGLDARPFRLGFKQHEGDRIRAALRLPKSAKLRPLYQRVG